MTAHDQHKNQDVIIPDITHLSNKDQAEKIAEYIAKIPNEYDQLRTEDIVVSAIDVKDIPQFTEVQVWE